MARKRFQRGHLMLRGDLWIGRWREDVIEDGKIKRVLGWHPLGTKNDYPTKKLALRALEDRLSVVNNLSYRPRPVAKFSEFAAKWEMIVLPNLKPSSRPPIKSQLHKHLLPAGRDQHRSAFLVFRHEVDAAFTAEGRPRISVWFPT